MKPRSPSSSTINRGRCFTTLVQHDCHLPRKFLTGFRITVVCFVPTQRYRFIVDHISEPGRARFHLHQAWVGQTVLLLK